MKRVRIARVGTNTNARMTTRTTMERGNGDEPLGRDARISRVFGTLVSRKRVWTRTRRHTMESTTDDGG